MVFTVNIRKKVISAVSHIPTSHLCVSISSVEMSEDAPVDSEVIMVEAKDRDSDDSIRYRIDDTDSTGLKYFKTVDIDNKGSIRVFSVSFCTFFFI